MTAHKHAKLMAEYAKDAMETDKPWERWETRMTSSDKWEYLTTNPHWTEGFEYRRKPRTINIGGIEVPEPMREAPEDGTTYYEAAIDTDGYFGKQIWNGHSYDLRILSHGLMHTNEEAAIAHAKALILISGGKVE